MALEKEFNQISWKVGSGACFGAVRPVGCQCPTVISCKTFTDRISGHSQGLEGIRFGGVRMISMLCG